MLEAEVARLTQQPVEVGTDRKKGVIDRQAIKDAVAAKEVAEREVLVRTNEIKKLRGSHDQIFLARNAEVTDLKMQLAAAQKKAADAEYDKIEDKLPMSELQSGH